MVEDVSETFFTPVSGTWKMLSSELLKGHYSPGLRMRLWVLVWENSDISNDAHDCTQQAHRGGREKGNLEVID